MKIKKQSFWILMVVVLFLGGTVGFALCSITGGFGGGSVKISNKEYKDLKYMKEKYSKLEAIWNSVDSNFYKAVDDEDLETSMYKGLVSGLGDKYSEYMTKDEYDSWIASTTGSYEGVGISFAEDKKGNMVVVQVMSKSPAKKAGIKEGDYILKVDGKKYKDSEKMAAAIRGDAGTKVKVIFERDGKQFTKTLKRASITNESVTTKQLSGNIGYIKITGFEDATDDDFEKILSSCEKKGNKGLIIDLRDNGGGLVDSATNIADDLLGKGVVTYLEDQNGKKEYYKSDSGKTDLPYVILVNGNTASASEILTAAVMDDSDNKVVGTKTYGKGIVQDTETMSDGSALKLTVMQYFSPDGNVIHKKGITPDYVVKGSAAQLKKAESLLR